MKPENRNLQPGEPGGDQKTSRMVQAVFRVLLGASRAAPAFFVLIFPGNISHYANRIGSMPSG